MFVSIPSLVFAETDKSQSNSSANSANELQLRDTGKPTKENEMDLKQTTSGADIIWNFIKVIFALGFIIVLIYLLIKFLSRKTSNFDSPRKLRIIAGIGLSPQKSLQVVEVGHKLYILGVGQDVNVLDKVEHPEEVAELIQSLDLSGYDQQFMNTWKERFSQLFKKKTVTSEDLDIEEYKKLFQTQLEDATSRQNETDQGMEDNKERSE